MNRKAVLVFALLCACHKREDAASTAMTAQPAPPPVDSTVVASPAPTESIAPIASASAAPDASLSPEEARRQALMQAREVGMIGLLNSMSDAGVGSVWGRDDSLGRGNMWGDAIGDDAGFGVGGLGLRGTGAGGGTGEGIGLGNIGALGHGSGGTGSGMGYGNGSGRLGGGNHPTPSVRAGATTVSGRLPPEVIQRIVRQNMGRFRLCYENGLRTDPKLGGSIAVKFVIDPQGAVSSATRDPSSTMTDASVVSCVTRAFSNLYFPAPEGGGSVSVMYPLNFAPG